MGKRESLESIASEIKSLSDMARTHPQIFGRAVTDKELEQLEGLVSGLCTNIEMQINERGESGKKNHFY